MFDFINNGRSFGTGYRKSDTALVQFYQEIYFDFGLTPPRHLKEGDKVPVKVRTDFQAAFGGKIVQFEIHGNNLPLSSFMSKGWGTVFHKISRTFPTSKSRVWSYDISRLHEGILSGEVVYDRSPAYSQSEEALHVLCLIDGALLKPLSNIPAVSMDFGPTWAYFGIPDRLIINLQSIYPFTDDDYIRVVNLVLHHYRSKGQDITAHYSWNPQTGTIEIMAAKTIPVPPQPAPEPAQPVTKPAQPNVNQEEAFPYEYFRKLGLIDDEDMVLMDFCGSTIRIPMTSDEGRSYLMNYQPNN